MRKDFAPRAIASLLLAGGIFARPLPVAAGGGSGCDGASLIQTERDFIMTACAGSNNIIVESITPPFNWPILRRFGPTEEGRNVGALAVSARCPDSNTQRFDISKITTRVLFKDTRLSCAFTHPSVYLNIP